jgi:hypothetical protein
MMSVQTRFKYISMKKILSLAALALGVSALVNGLFSTSAYAAPVTSDVQIEVSVPDIVFLQTYTKLTFDVVAADLTNGTPGTADTTVGAGTVDTGATVSPSLPPVANTVVNGGLKDYKNVLLYRTWGLGGSAGNITHDAVVATSTLTSATAPSSTIDLSLVKSASTPASPTAAPGISGTTTIDGSVDFTFDLNNVKASGLHTGGIVTVSAEGV